jgi:hypothetical protein
MVTASACAALAPRVAAAATKVELLVIGNNQPPPGASADGALSVLRFADDDAAAFYDLMSGFADAGHLLTVMDGDTQALYPNLVASTRSPTLAQVRDAVADLGRRIEDNRRQGHRNVVYVFFSGHGALQESGGPALALLDGGITQQVLYDEIIAKLPADYIHVFVDACHAEAVVRPRDVEARRVPVPPADADAFLVRSTLARFPHVGAIVAATSDAQTHEWDRLRQGVFTHELLSALHGAADVNRDGRIEYSEIYAFLASANRSVGNAQARLAVVARPPELDRHIAVIDWSGRAATTTGRLVGISAGAGLVEVEDESGRRIATLRGEPGYVTDLVVPAGKPVYVRAGGREARVDVAPGDGTRFDTLAFHDRGERARGALEDAVSRGLFASEFGRGYYLGFIDQAPEFAAVSFPEEQLSRSATPVDVSRDQQASSLVPARLLVGIGAANTVARAFEVSPTVRVSAHAAGDRGFALAIDLADAQATGIAERRATISAGWLWSANLGPARGWLGGMIGGGAIEQSASSAADRWTGVAGGGPSSGVTLDIARRLGVWGEAQLDGLVYRRDGQTAFVLMPVVFAGVALAL